ncbi:hypothetical protein PV327_001997 [Microctonus hyperodae]|uniref:Glutaminyl-peptide cyclotransferase n=1 Tax=Microctonus hyperodae TaxID=165561 RepID=A0AA39FEU8_MICHY|nr:hypothetical protein PV327_001997 [Microctonus hyperodae]
MFKIWINLFFLLFSTCIAVQKNFRNEKFLHQGQNLTEEQIRKLIALTNVAHMDEILDNICVPRVVGTQQHENVKNYIKRSMENLEWNVEEDKFEQKVPIYKNKLQFANIIAKINPNSRRFLAMACHYDSKYTSDGNFEGATDSAVPCAQLINLATVMREQLKQLKQNHEVSLMFIFFDGEEAFKKWGPNDSIYGAKHLAKKWHRNLQSFKEESDISDLDRIDMLMLLDLIGAPDPRFYNYFDSTKNWYIRLIQAEQQLANMSAFEGYIYGSEEDQYFQPFSFQAHIEDDHIPFMHKNVPILHLIPSPFPVFWHEPGDNRRNVSMSTTENLNKILRVFIADYFRLQL